MKRTEKVIKAEMADVMSKLDTANMEIIRSIPSRVF